MTRSEMMSRIRSKNTGPERRLRKILREMLVQFRSQVEVGGYVRDFALAWCRVAVEVHGCFWHGCPRHYRAPKTNHGFWGEKVRGNVLRDKTSARAVRRAGWRNVTLWECESTSVWMRKIDRAIASHLKSPGLLKYLRRGLEKELQKREAA